MRTLAAATLIASLVIGPVAARAEAPAIIPVQSGGAGVADGSGVDAGKLIAIGAGLVIGGAIGASTLTFRGATLVGAAAGGIIAAWWYGDGDETVPLNTKKP
jgi:hypothetical protein